MVGVSARRSCCVPVTRARILPPTMSRSSAGHWTRPGSAPDPVERCWCASTGPEVRRRPLSSWPVGGCPTAWGSYFPSTRRRSTTPSPRPPGPRPTTLTASPGMVRTSPRTADLLDLTAWPKGMRVIMRRERPHQGARLRFEDVGGYRLTAFATSTRVGQLADLEVRHRLRARCEDRIRCAKDTGLDRFPLQGFAQNRIWCLIVALARRPAGLLPAARPGRRPRPRLGAPDDPPAADEHPRCHRPPRPPHRPALQGRPPLDQPSA